MPTAIALRSFDHNGKVTKGEPVTFDRITMEALRRSRLVGPDVDEAGEPPAKPKAPKAPVPTVGSLGNARKPKTGGNARKPKVGAKSSALPAAPALPPVTSTPSAPGDLPPPLPVASS